MVVADRGAVGADGIPLKQAVRDTRTLLELMVRGLVDIPDKVAIRCLEGTQSVVFEVVVDPTDIRRVIGRKGRIADAIRELITSYGGKSGRRYLVEIVEPAWG